MTTFVHEMTLLNYGLFGVGYFLFVNTVHYSQACDSFLTNEWMNFLFMMLGFLGTLALSTASPHYNSTSTQWNERWPNTLLIHMYVLCALLLTDSVHDANYNIFILLLAFAFIACSEVVTAYILVAIIAETMAFAVMLLLMTLHEPQHYFEHIQCHVAESLAMSVTSGVIHAIPLCATVELNSMAFGSRTAQIMAMLLHILVMLILVLAPSKVWVASLLDTATVDILMHGVSNVELLTVAYQCLIMFTVITFTVRYHAYASHKPDYTRLLIVFLIAGTCKQYSFVQIKWIYIATAIVYAVDKLLLLMTTAPTATQ